MDGGDSRCEFTFANLEADGCLLLCLLKVIEVKVMRDFLEHYKLYRRTIFWLQTVACTHLAQS